MGCNERDTKSKLQPSPGGKLVVTVTKQVCCFTPEIELRQIEIDL